MMLEDEIKTNKINDLYKKFNIPIKKIYTINFRNCITGEEYFKGISLLKNETIEDVINKLSTGNDKAISYTEQLISTFLSTEQIVNLEELILSSGIDKVNKEFTVEKYGCNNNYKYAYALNKINYHEDYEFLHEEDRFFETEFYDTRSEALADLVLFLWDEFSIDDKNKIKEILINNLFNGRSV